jgi:sulfite exporter TauE/SafE
MSDSPELDIRWPIGLLFAVIGALVAAYGFFTGGQAQPADFNLNLWWGLVMLLFGLGLLWGARRASKSSRE